MSRLPFASLFVFFLAFASRPGLTQTTSPVAVTYQVNAQHNASLRMDDFNPPLRVKWSVDLGAMVSYPLIAAKKVFVLAGDLNVNAVNLYALDAHKGAILWGPVPIPIDYAPWAAAAYDNGKIFVVPTAAPGALTGAVYAYDANNGNRLWTAELPVQASITAPPTARDGVVYVSDGSSGTLFALRESDGTVVWTNSVLGGDFSSPVVTADSVYVSYPGPQAYDFAVGTGILLWHPTVGIHGGGGKTSVLYQNRLYVRDAYLVPGFTGDVLDAATGQVVGGFNADFAPAFRNGRGFYIQAFSINAVDVTSGTTLWTAAPPGDDNFSSPPLIINGIVYVGTASGYLVGYRTDTGAKVVCLNLQNPIYAYEGFDLGLPATGLGAGQGLLIVPASTRLFALSH